MEQIELRYFAPNGIVTYEDCPVCGAPDMRVEHGKSGWGSLQHFECCTECGDSMPIVCYDCKYCEIALEADMKSGDWAGYDPTTTDDEARKLAARRLGISEKHIEVLRTGGVVLARERQEGQDDQTAFPNRAQGELVSDNVNSVVSEAQTVTLAP